MSKIPQCDRCLFYAKTPYLLCPVNPNGIEGDRCLDFRPKPTAEEEQLWEPEGYSWYGGELIPNRRSPLTQEEQLKILDTHPLFTGVCPECGYKFDLSKSPPVHWDCPQCGWMDDSVH